MEEPGHYQFDLVGHDGGNTRGEFAFSLDCEELFSGWVEPRSLKNRAHRWTVQAFDDVEKKVPVKIKSIHYRQRGRVYQQSSATVVPEAGNRLLSWSVKSKKRYLLRGAKELQHHPSGSWLCPI